MLAHSLGKGDTGVFFRMHSNDYTTLHGDMRPWMPLEGKRKFMKMQTPGHADEGDHMPCPAHCVDLAAACGKCQIMSICAKPAVGLRGRPQSVSKTHRPGDKNWALLDTYPREVTKAHNDKKRMQKARQLRPSTAHINEPHCDEARCWSDSDRSER